MVLHVAIRMQNKSNYPGLIMIFSQIMFILTGIDFAWILPVLGLISAFGSLTKVSGTSNFGGAINWESGVDTTST